MEAFLGHPALEQCVCVAIVASVANLEKRIAATFCAGISRRVTRGSADLGKACRVYFEGMTK